MKSLRHFLAAFLVSLATLAVLAQTALKQVPKTSPSAPAVASIPRAPAPIPINRLVVVIDPGHGGMDSGSQISDTTLEKDVTLALGFRLRSLLSARGFAVVMTRDADTPAEPDAQGAPLTLDDRAGLANHAHAAACLLLHATGSGTGVHLYSSELEATAGQPPVKPWLTAQAAWVPQSELLEENLAAALKRAGVALITSRASVRPVDSLTCPALVVELAPQGSNPDSINDDQYQQRIAQAIAGALVFWRNQVQPPPRLSAAAAAVPFDDQPEPQP